MANTSRRSFLHLLKCFHKDPQGSVLILYAGLALPFFAIVGGAIDYARVVSDRSELIQASDAAAIAAGNLSSKPEDIPSIFDAHFKANLPNRLAKTPYKFEVDNDTGKITATIDHAVKMHFAAILGIKHVKVSVKATGQFVIMANNEGSPFGTGKPVGDAFDLEAEKRRIMRNIRAQVKRARLQGVKLPEISEKKLEKYAEHLARQSKR
ncbi:MAG: TadE/TadG family type IV pilus assembly protein [Hyphomicrobiaceae bacterium]